MSVQSPIVSVIMSVYNAEEYLDEAIRSILEQSFSDFEFILVNDGSSDSSGSIIQKYASQDERIKVISRENKGLIASLNEAVAIARGKFIARMDADDISHPTRIARQVAVMEDDAGIVVCGTSFIEFGSRRNRKAYVLDSNHSHPRVELMFGPPVVHPSTMLRVSALPAHGALYCSGFIHAEDYELWTRLIKAGRFVNIPEPLVQLRYRDDSVTRVADLNPFGQRFDVISSIQQEYLRENGIVCDQRQCRLHYLLSDHHKAVLDPTISYSEIRTYVIWLMGQVGRIRDIDAGYARGQILLRYAKVLFALWRSGKIGISRLLSDKLLCLALVVYGRARIGLA